MNKYKATIKKVNLYTQCLPKTISDTSKSGTVGLVKHVDLRNRHSVLINFITKLSRKITSTV